MIITKIIFIIIIIILFYSIVKLLKIREYFRARTLRRQVGEGVVLGGVGRTSEEGRIIAESNNPAAAIAALSGADPRVVDALNIADPSDPLGTLNRSLNALGIQNDYIDLALKYTDVKKLVVTSIIEGDASHMVEDIENVITDVGSLIVYDVFGRSRPRTRYTCPTNQPIKINKQYCPSIAPNLSNSRPCCINPSFQYVNTISNISGQYDTGRSLKSFATYIGRNNKLYIWLGHFYWRFSFKIFAGLNWAVKENPDQGYPKTIKRIYNQNMPHSYKSMFVRYGTGKEHKDKHLYIFAHNTYYKYKSKRLSSALSIEAWKMRYACDAAVQATNEHIYFFYGRHYYIYPNKGSDRRIKRGLIKNLLRPKLKMAKDLLNFSEDERDRLNIHNPDNQKIVDTMVINVLPKRIDSACKDPNDDTIYLMHYTKDYFNYYQKEPHIILCYRYKIINEHIWILRPGYPQVININFDYRNWIWNQNPPVKRTN